MVAAVSEEPARDHAINAARAGGAGDVPAGYKRTEVGMIPEDWDSSSVRAIASSRRNAIVGGPFGSDLVSNDYVSHGVPVIRGQNMSDRWVSGSFVFVTPTKAKSLEANLAHPRDVVFTQRGTLGQVSLVPDEPFDAYLVSQSQMKLSLDLSVADPLFLFYFFTSLEQQKSIQGATVHSTGVPHINLGLLCEMRVRLPPMAEQCAIAEALSDVDGLLESLDALIAKKRAIKQAAMQQLLTGRTRLPGFSGKWETKRVGEVVSVRNEKVLPSHVAPDTICVELEHVASGDGRLLRTTSSQDTVSSKYRFFSGDVLFGRLRPYLRKFWLADRDGICTTEIWPLVPSPGLMDSRFLLGVIQSDAFITAANISYGTHMPRADWTVMREFEFKLPPLNEQAAIAAVLSDMDAEVAGLETRRDKTLAIKQGMMQQLLTGRVRLV